MKSHRYTPVEISVADHLIGPSDALLTMGSCFAKNMGSRLQKAKSPVLSNPLGILYNPISIARQLAQVRGGRAIAPYQCGCRGDVYFHYDYHSQMAAMSPEAVARQINAGIETTAHHLSNCKWIVLTLGTSFAYTLRATGAVVASCHKMPASLFDKRLLTVEESVAALVSALPVDMHVIVTVSPIRHTKEGLADNQRSKARLIEVAHRLVEELQQCTYFPAYELLMDELRDYRYFQKDLIHPTEEAVDIVWDRFKQTYFTPAALQRIAAIEKLQQSLHHRPLVKGSAGHQAFVQDLLTKIQELTRQYPQLDLSREADDLRASLRV